MKVGVIGTGTMGRNHLRIYNDLRGVDEIFVFDADSTVSKQVAHQFNIQSAESLDELLGKVDAVSVCVPTSKHYEIAQEVLAKGVNCLIEKPVASGVEEAKKIVELANKSNVIVGVGHIERFNPVIQEIRKIMKSPRYVEILRHNPGSVRITDTDVINDLMIHDIDILWNFLFRDTKYIIRGTAQVKKKVTELGVVLVDFEGCIVKLSASRLSAKKTRQIVVEEDEKTSTGDLMAQEIYVYKKDHGGKLEDTKYSQESTIDKVLVNKVEPLREELKMFLNCVKNSKPFPISTGDGLRALEIATEIQRRMEL
ncbi:UDP-N-acetylglucosamine 3-dehydrogenase [Candidatus Bilamarchaeum dharawalense]|uniref:UDP-N-acetylglucosamine 3-dehydrogenase n=1 Tax=Candidatus Bilamarchaeum dharawalense TaxID=2885759 RepID=A0A5E4LQS0_9ARCH|nr:UDP-N-acetylglucosamine 3-dehydrogenase [Candidatus Bilamarchaeum dharawalense]